MESPGQKALKQAGRNRTETDTDEDDDALEDEVDNDELLANDQEENDAEVASEEKETEADAIERITEEITERCEETMDKLTEALELFEEIPVRKIDVEAGGKVTWIRYRLVKVTYRDAHILTCFVSLLFGTDTEVGECNGYHWVVGWTKVKRICLHG
ncbi:unnamed protein product [Dicrocoelium dendriticum]|nr:unnamed protein product [Dicrocoelium dendriticum]